MRIPSTTAPAEIIPIRKVLRKKTLINWTWCTDDRLHHDDGPCHCHLCAARNPEEPRRNEGSKEGTAVLKSPRERAWKLVAVMAEGGEGSEGGRKKEQLPDGDTIKYG